ncbi:MAG: DNA repair protein RecO [Mogibacterium sp.]|nr:DNA repair protein RecO [Mogibacterium sp.]
MIITTEGIVLRQRKIANNRRMIVLFTKQYGKLSAGTSVNEKSRSKAALALRPFTYAEYDIFKGRETYSINSAQVNKSFFSIGEDIDRFMNASAFIEYLDKVLEEGVPAPKLFDLSLEFLQSVSECRTGMDTLLYAFIVKTFRTLGVAPELSCCVNCGKAPGNFGKGFPPFSVSSGGIICPECAEEEKRAADSLIYKPDFDIISVFRYFDSKPIKTFEKIDLKLGVRSEVREILSEYTSRYLGVDVLRPTRGLEV